MRSPEALKPRETHRTPDWPGAELSMETIRAYLADLSGRGTPQGHGADVQCQAAGPL